MNGVAECWNSPLLYLMPLLEWLNWQALQPQSHAHFLSGQHRRSSPLELLLDELLLNELDELLLEELDDLLLDELLLEELDDLLLDELLEDGIAKPLEKGRDGRIARP
jgi:hypothetical protein